MQRLDRARRRLLRGVAGLAIGAAVAPAASGRAATESSGARPRRVIIDTDPGIDDALAIFLALASPELEVAALTAVAGNVPLELTLPNALRLLEIAGRAGIPVAAGASRPLRRQLVTAAYVHGHNGLGGVEFPAPSTRPVDEPAPQLIRRIVRATPGEVSIIAIGPLTNLALAFQADPELPSLLRGLTIMGGSLSGGNITPAAEFNSYVDPEAAQIVYRSGAPITMVGLDVTRKVVLGEPQVAALERSGHPAGRAAGRMLRAALSAVRQSGANGGQLLVHDALAVAVCVDPSLVTLEDRHVRVETAGEFTAGETVGYRKAPMRRSAPWADSPAVADTASYQPNARVAVDVDAGRCLALLVERVAPPG